jgi:hypothetical protein
MLAYLLSVFNTTLRPSYASKKTMRRTPTGTMNPPEQAMDSPTSHNSLLTEFPLFSKLPLELRLKVWKHALPIGPHGLRMIKVAVSTIVTTSTTTTSIQRKGSEQPPKSKIKETKASSSLTFCLLEHKHNDYLRDLGMLRACSEYVYPECSTNPSTINF